MSEELKCCPFCDGSLVMWQHPGVGKFSIYCADCKTEGPLAPTVELATQTWNTRPLDDLLRARIAELEAENDRLETALQRIQSWSEAYPLTVFPEPDFELAHDLLKAGGMTLDAIAASNMRHVVRGVGKIARDALKEPTTDGQP